MNELDGLINELVESQVEALVEDDSYYQALATPLKPASAFKREHRRQLEDFFKLTELRKQFEEAPKLILNLLPNLVSTLEFNQVKDELDKSSENFIKNMAIGSQSSEKPVLFQELFGLSDETLMSIYDLGVDLVQKENFDHANTLFVFLTTLAPHVTSYWIAQGVCLQALDRHKDAIAIFDAAKVLDPSEPALSAYTIESYLALKEKDKASLEIDALKEIIKSLSGDKKLKWEAKINEMSV